jgi:uncharacterized ion transporter superfamily protein YfcC
MAEEKKGFKFPSAYTILFILIIIVAIATWIVPAGQYEVNEAGEPIPGSYHPVESNPQRVIADGLMAIVNGTYGIQAEDGTIRGDRRGFFRAGDWWVPGHHHENRGHDAGIASITTSLQGREKWMIAILMAVFALGGTTYGMAEETLAFYGLIVAVMIAAGYDALVGVAVVMIGAGIGTLASTINPFATGIASAFAGTSVGDGLVSRLIILVVGTLIGIWFVSRYAEKVKKDPSKSLVFDQKEANEKFFLKQLDAEELPELIARRKWILVLFALAFLIMIFSVIPWGDLGVTLPNWLPQDWWFGEFSALFLFFAIIIGFVDRMGESNIAETFVDGARDMLGVALIIGVARGVSVIMTNGLIVDTVLFWAESALTNVGGVVFINFTHLLYLPLGFLIPSSSGLATVTMPIMAPLADFAAVDRSLVVTAFQSASGLLNLVNPTFAVVMGGLALGRVGYDKWWKFTWPLLVILLLLYALVLSVGVFFPGQIF